MRLDGVDYEDRVVWNGCVDGRDSDLLRKDLRIPEKVIPGSKSPTAHNQIALDAVRACLRRQAGTRDAISDQTGLSLNVVSRALQGLMGEGILRWDALPVPWGGPRRRYWVAK